ncbi:MAG: SPOR domain-containing protein [Bacteroidales bacterium]|nr:SPOR domain-containing protein [Bacteroidales bacterium]
MKKIFGMVAVATLILSATSCKSSSESAYKKAYEKAQAAKQAANQSAASAHQVAIDAAQTAQTATQQAYQTPVTIQQPTTTTTSTDVRRINGNITVLGGGQIQAYSVVVGSFTSEANAQGLLTTLKNTGYTSAQIIKTDETINGITGWYRVIATTHNTREAAATSRDGLRGKYTGAWLLAK